MFRFLGLSVWIEVRRVAIAETIGATPPRSCFFQREHIASISEKIMGKGAQSLIAARPYPHNLDSGSDFKRRPNLAAR